MSVAPRGASLPCEGCIAALLGIGAGTPPLAMRLHEHGGVPPPDFIFLKVVVMSPPELTLPLLWPPLQQRILDHLPREHRQPSERETKNPNRKLLLLLFIMRFSVIADSVMVCWTRQRSCRALIAAPAHLRGTVLHYSSALLEAVAAQAKDEKRNTLVMTKIHRGGHRAHADPADVATVLHDFLA
ncbi:hypothetical protein BDK51DRAFT_31913 [Blyttiomyces helicus]|uniref:Uncharacterized protein n=1 Tax=Blyttiomyces helicus TaxID=388810 RepID=A0A4P9W2C3_9FUNG|nr:hypothetical protein BDK51DRAFT_31913 [Blyttiomyces helicus]|eukprot:RKO85872.1 hypothetical protein BDK51DRAFT_31913 [Blyttiomyces helicus]